jgi:hypothetical protein
MAIETMTPDQYRKMLTEAMTEKDLQAHVRSVATVNGWRAFCWWSSLHSPAGWPDLVLVREVNDSQARLLFVELKSEKGKFVPEQEEAHRLLRLTGHQVYVWRQSDLLSGRVEEVLA